MYYIHLFTVVFCVSLGISSFSYNIKVMELCNRYGAYGKFARNVGTWSTIIYWRQNNIPQEFAGEWNRECRLYYWIYVGSGIGIGLCIIFTWLLQA